jgi:hypothetical protein
MSLIYTLDWAALQISKESKAENALVRKRVAKLCKDILALKPYVENIPTHKDFIGICKTREEFRRRFDEKHYCAACHKDITSIGGWQFPQEPKKFYCTDCQSEKFMKSLKRSGGAK